MAVFLSRETLHMRDQRITEARRRHQRGTLHQALEIIGHGLGRNGAIGALDDQISSFNPTPF